MKILFLIPYPLEEAPSQRFRFEQYLNRLQEEGHEIRIQSFLSDKGWKLFFNKGKSFHKFLTIARGFLKRTRASMIANSFDYVFIHREATPLGPPIFEWFIACILRKKIIYDFDDAIWLTDRVNESWILKTLKWRSKVAAICSWSTRVSCGNQYLTHFAASYNNRAIVNPTTIDTEHHHNRRLFQVEVNDNPEVIIGWTGSHSTLKYLKLLEPVLQKLEANYSQVSFLIIADKPPALHLTRLRFIPWNAETEIPDLLSIDIGIMPLPDDEWSKGKCGFKALQYMALEIPAVVSPVGVNKDIITNGVEGFICSTDEDWFNALEQLIRNRTQRISMGKKGRQKVEADYSVISNSSNFLSLFE